MNRTITGIGGERTAFMKAQDKIRGQIQNFEEFLDESRAASDANFVNLKKEVTERLEGNMQ